MTEVMWEAAEPCLSEEQRLAALTALHVGEPSQALLVVVTALSRSGHPLPSDLHVSSRSGCAIVQVQDRPSIGRSSNFASRRPTLGQLPTWA